MKRFFKYIIYLHLFFLVKLISFIKRPYIVLVVWVSHKAIIREKLKDAALEKWLNTRHKYMPYNTWFGVLLDFLALPSAYWNIKWWIGIYFYSCYKFFKSLLTFPNYIFLCWGIDEKWESNKFIKSLKPNMIVFTDIDNSLTDDYKALDIVEKEFWNFVDYLNKKAKKENIKLNIDSIDDIVNMIKAKEQYVWVISKNDNRLLSIWDKLINKTFINL